MPKDRKVMTSIENFRITELTPNTWSGELVTTIRKIESFASSQQSLPGTRIRVLREATSPYLRQPQSMPVFDEDICIKRFAPHVDAYYAPFRCTIRGIVIAVSPMDHTKNADRPELKVCFEVMDNEGTWIRCCATGENAKSTGLQTDIEIILFFGTALAPSGKSSGMLYVLKDSTIVPVGRKTSPQAKQLEPWLQCVARELWASQ